MSLAVKTSPQIRLVAGAALVALGYFLGSKIGFALTFQPHPVSTLWPPNAVLLAALLLAPRRAWWMLVLAVFPAHVAVQLGSGVPVALLFCWFVSNCSEALIGAWCVRRFVDGPLRFDDSRHVGVFAFAALVAVFLSSFLDAGFVTLAGVGQGAYGEVWRLRFFSNVLAALTLVPAIITLAAMDFGALRRASPRRLAEGAALALGLLGVSVPIFAWEEAGPERISALVYVPLPFLLWAAARFGPIGTSMATLGVAVVALWGAMQGRGPFLGGTPQDNALSLQLFLILVSIPLMLLSAVIHERRRAERAAVLNEERLKLALNAARMSIWDWSIRAAATAPRPRNGVGLDQMLGLVHPEDRPAVADAVTRAIETGSAWDVEFRVVHPDGSVEWVMAKGDFERDERGRVVRMFGVSVDVTDRKRADEALRASEALFAKAFRGSPVSMVISRRADGRIIDVNDRWAVRFGCPREAAVGRTLGELLIGASAADAAALRRLTEASGPVHDVDLRIVTGAQELRELVVATEAVEMGGDQCFITMLRDITERQRARREAQEQREQLAHLGRVAVLGELSGALAHELSQPLTAILSNAQAARRMLASDSVDLPEIRAIIEDVIEADRRAGEVIRRLRAMLKRGESKRQLLDLNQVIRDVLELAHSDLVTRHVRVAARLDPGLPKVSGDAVQLQQVLLNLIVNACEAMADNPPDDRTLAIESAVADRDTIEVSVLDNGCGIPTDILDRLFEPFVTTKRHGLGLGLPICRSIAAVHGGRLWSTGNADRGSAFHLSLPRDGAVPPAA
ncbi:MAG: MASE1 domain-containing protein [Candidatus Rokuibacteriota bacterium]